METEVAKCSVDKKYFEIEKKELHLDNDCLLDHIICQDVMNVVMHANDHHDNVLPNCLVHDNSVDILAMSESCVDECNKCLALKTKLFKNKDLIEKDENSCKNQNAPTFNQLFKINELKAQSQEKDTVIRKLKDKIKSSSGIYSVENVKKDIDEIERINIKLEHSVDIDEIERINIKLEHSVVKLLSENENLRKEQEHLKSIYKDQFDLIKKTRVRSKEHCDSLIAQIDAKSIENLDLNAQLQEKVFAIAALENELRKLKRKMTRRVRFAESNDTLQDKTQKQVQPQDKPTTNNDMSPSTRVSFSADASGSKPMSDTKKDRISQTLSSNKKKNKVEDQPSIAKSSLNNVNHISKIVGSKNVKHSVLNTNS
uniref:Pyruvate, phosphate dikinase regulatory protein, chloroplastic n=1 Tax=Tanacetum cinerariifolium TaxID=118510 RepID=A0A699JSA5_TANCI|nr:hypothetical protein [Tanacetum cinerariifolium]